MEKEKDLNDALAKLTEEQRDMVREWLEEGKSYRDIAALIGKAEPDGFGIKTSYSAVARFAKNEEKAKFLAELGDDEASARELMQITEMGSVDFTKATLRTLQRKVFRAAAEAKGEAACEMLRRLTEMEQRQQRIGLAEKNFELSKVRFEFNTGRELMRKAGMYVKVYEQPALDNEDKVWEARRICFGTSAGETGASSSAEATEDGENAKGEPKF